MKRPRIDKVLAHKWFKTSTILKKSPIVPDILKNYFEAQDELRIQTQLRRQSYYYESTINPSASIIELSQLVDKNNSILFRNETTFIRNEQEEDEGDANYVEDFDFNTEKKQRISMEEVPILTIAEESSADSHHCQKVKDSIKTFNVEALRVAMIDSCNSSNKKYA